MCFRRRRFAIITLDPDSDREIWAAQMSSRHHLKDINASLWIWQAAGLMLLSNILYIVAFLTNGWGVVSVSDSPRNHTVWYNYGLWQYCDSSSVCGDPGWPVFYGATRAFLVLGLFGHVLTVALMIGYMLEDIVDYDPCMIRFLYILSFFTSFSVTVAVITFGVRWPPDYAALHPGSATRLSYSFILTCITILLTLGSGVLGIIERRTRILSLTLKNEFEEKSKKENVTSLHMTPLGPYRPSEGVRHPEPTISEADVV